MESQQNRAQLRRALSLPLITLYGLGTIVGAGIYVLVGKVAGAAGMSAPFAFLLVFVLVNLSLIAIKRHQSPPSGIRAYPHWVPYGGLLSALALLAFSTLSMFGFSAQARRPPASPGFDHCIRLAAPVSACLVATSHDNRC